MCVHELTLSSISFLPPPPPSPTALNCSKNCSIVTFCVSDCAALMSQWVIKIVGRPGAQPHKEHEEQEEEEQKKKKDALLYDESFFVSCFRLPRRCHIMLT